VPSDVIVVARGLLKRPSAMIKLTRLHNQIVVVNPDHIESAEALPDTTLKLLGGERILVRESLDELIARVVDYRRSIRDRNSDDAISVAAVTERHRADAEGDE
jgi:flagellar protein FlbD